MLGDASAELGAVLRSGDMRGQLVLDQLVLIPLLDPHTKQTMLNTHYWEFPGKTSFKQQTWLGHAEPGVSQRNSLSCNSHSIVVRECVHKYVHVCRLNPIVSHYSDCWCQALPVFRLDQSLLWKPKPFPSEHSRGQEAWAVAAATPAVVTQEFHCSGTPSAKVKSNSFFKGSRNSFKRFILFFSIRKIVHKDICI